MRLVFVLVFFAHNLVVLGCEDWLVPFGVHDLSQEIAPEIALRGLGLDVPYELELSAFNGRRYLEELNWAIVDSLDEPLRKKAAGAIFNNEIADDLLLLVHDFKYSLINEVLEHPVVRDMLGLQLFSDFFVVESERAWQLKNVLRYSREGSLNGYAPRMNRLFVVGMYYFLCVRRAVSSIVDGFLIDPERTDLEVLFLQDWITLSTELDIQNRINRKVPEELRNRFHSSVLGDAFSTFSREPVSDPNVYIYTDAKKNKSIKFVYTFSGMIN